jgi:hypothetical protein
MRLLVSFVAIASLTMGQSDDTKKFVLIDDILNAQNIEGTVQQMFTQMKSVMHQQIESGTGTLPATADRAAMAADLKEMETQIFDLMAARFTSASFKPLVAKIYMEEFTLDEIQAIRDFQMSPAGQAMIKKQAAIAMKSMQAGQQLMRGAMQEITQLTNEWAEKMKKKYGGQ